MISPIILANLFTLVISGFINSSTNYISTNLSFISQPFPSVPLIIKTNQADKNEEDDDENNDPIAPIK